MDTGRITYFENIPAEPKMNMILARLGYHKNTTIINSEHQKTLEKSIRLGLGLAKLKGAYGYFNIIEKTNNYITLKNQQTFHSEKLSGLLEHSDAVVLMASTAGKAIVERISEETKNGNAAVALILDSVASQKADAGLDWLMEFINKLLKKEGKTLTRHRFSPGYGDLPLSNQKIIFDLLDLNKLDMELTEKYILVPEKSVLAIAGIERIESYE